MSQSSKRGLDSSRNDRYMLVFLANQITVYNDCPIRAFSHLAAGCVGIGLPVLFRHCIMIDHGIHIPGADYIDTNEVESEPLWNKVSDEQLKAMLAKHGIRHDTTVILYGRDVYAGARVAQIMLYAGVKDVRLLDGGWQTWSDAGLPVERGTPPKVKAEPDFGVKIPAQPQLMLDMEQARGLLHRQDASLVSIRSWPEFIGTTSGYSYIKPKGEIAGARWGHAGSDSTHMEDFHNPDGTMRSADDITAMWKAWNIKPEQQVSFYCGTGWRASETFMYARAMGWKNVSVYDGGWYEWSSDPKNPVATGERGPDSSK